MLASMRRSIMSFGALLFLLQVPQKLTRVNSLGSLDAFIMTEASPQTSAGSLPRGKKWDAAIWVLASWSFLGAVNNTLVIMGIFSGWVI
jgi:hypothetical protein